MMLELLVGYEIKVSVFSDVLFSVKFRIDGRMKFI